MNRIYDAAIISGEKFEMPEGKQNLAAFLNARFPKEASAIKRYFEIVAHEQETAPLFYAWKILAGLLPAWIIDWLKPKMAAAHIKISDRTVTEALDELTENKVLQAALTYHYGNYGLPPSNASLAIHAMVANHYFEGGAYPEGGAAEFARRIIPAVRKNQGGVLVRARVRSLLIDDKTDPAHPQVAGVVVDRDGKVIQAKKVICACGVKNTFLKLLPKDQRHWIGSDVSDLEDEATWKSPKGQTSSAHLSLFVALKGTKESLKLPATNFWINPSIDFDERCRSYLSMSADDVKRAAETGNHDALVDFPAVFLSFPSTKDGDWHRRYPNKSTAHIITEAPISWFKEWENERLHHRGPVYEKIKAMFTKRLLDHMFSLYPHLQGRVEFAELGTPLSSKYYLGADGGESYGLGHSPQRFRKEWLRPHTRIRSLYLTGADTLSAGVFGALTSGFLTAVAIDLEILWENLGALVRL